ncbi:MAG: peptidase U32 family protein [Desulfomicrobium sp.]|nr:peptidase U32 family protein [Desulfomicrobium sp.]
MTTLPELLVPAGDPDKLATALAYGADAVYLGGQALSLRAATGGFSFPELRDAVNLAHSKNAKVYFALNLLAREEHLPGVEGYLEELAGINVDGLIIADPGIMAMALRRVPHIPVHVSTQASTSNSATAMFWRDLGARRVNVARELGASRIRAMVEKVPNLEFEVFVHGAMCMAVSGRCLLSSHLNKRSGNLGQCTHPCRFDYKVTAVRLEERLRPGEDTWEVRCDGDFSQVMAAEDLCLIKYLNWFCRVGITSLKIEGRMKTLSYLAQVTDVYRTALNDLAAGAFRPGLYLEELQQLATRPLSSAFFTPAPVTLRPALSRSLTKNIVGRLAEPAGDGRWVMDVKHRFESHAPLEILLPGLSRPVLGAGDYDVENAHGERLATVHGGMRVVLRCAHPGLTPGMFLRAHHPGVYNNKES